ncbi:MAG: hypothetical protein M1816_003734, partial [Peltula sp. TS41687]
MIQLLLVLGPVKGHLDRRTRKSSGGVDDQPPPPPPPTVTPKSASEKCIKRVLNAHWAGRFGRPQPYLNFKSLRQNCEEVEGDVADVDADDWREYFRLGSNRCYDVYCADKD